MHELMFAYELRERLIVCRSLIAHLKTAKRPDGILLTKIWIIRKQMRNFINM